MLASAGIADNEPAVTIPLVSMGDQPFNWNAACGLSGVAGEG